MVDTPQTKNRKILIIGYGSMGKKYEKILKKNFSIFFFDKKKSKSKFFVKKINVEIIKKFYFVIISTPPNYHKYYCEICAKAGKDFIVEKPLFLRNMGWKKLINVVKNKKLICGVAYPRRESEAYSYIKKLIDKGKIGKLKIIRSNYSQDFRSLRKDYKKIYYSNMKESGGIVYDALSHHINLQSYIAGQIKKIKKEEMRLVFNDIKVNDTALISIKFNNKIIGTIFGNQFQKPNIDEIEFIGTKNNLIYDRIENHLFIVNKNRKLLKKFSEKYEDLFKKQIENFLICIKKRIQPKTTLSEELHNLSKF